MAENFLLAPSLEEKSSPMMEQWKACKEKAKEALLFFRLGDFYEAFHEDALIISKELDLTLTKRQKVPMCGVPFHTSELYVDRLVSRGYRVAIAEQMEDPKSFKGLVKREVTRILSPGTLLHSSLLVDKANNFFITIAQVGKLFGLCAVDFSTAELKVVEIEGEKELLDELFRLKPSELLIGKKFQENHSPLLEELSRSFPFVLNTKEEWHFDYKTACQRLLNHFGLHTLDGFGLKGFSAAIIASGVLLAHLSDELHLNLSSLKSLRIDHLSSYMAIDASSLKNLELLESLSEKGKKNTLFFLLDKTSTPMGGRLLREWIAHPLLSISSIQKRHEAVEEFLRHPDLFSVLDASLDNIRDLERLIIKVASDLANPRDLVGLRFSLENIVDLRKMLEPFSSEFLKEQKAFLKDFSPLTTQIAKALVDAPPIRLGEGNTFRDGFYPEIDELRQISKDTKQWIAEYQATLREKTQIRTLKVGFTRAFGYYIEVSRGKTEKIPDFFQRRQTLVNGERFTTEELKNFEYKLLHAEERIKALEITFFDTLRKEVAAFSEEILRLSKALAHIDLLLSLAKAAKEYRYCRPIVDDSDLLCIKRGRHPIIEEALEENKFIANDTLLDDKDNRLFLITGPNMAGKSTYIRQVALIVILAQMGSFVPADFAHIGIVDKVFSRIGASDDLSRGQSTFMVEMSEAANILNNATARSLVILDEIGRGTSTFDGISIAWAVAEYLLTTKEKRARTLFATHYSELTELEGEVPGAVNYHIAVEEREKGIVFLRKIIRGSTDKSYGIHVARLAGLPHTVLQKAEERLCLLEKREKIKENAHTKRQEQLFLNL